MEKRYYWLKLKNDFFSAPLIKKLRRIAGGDTYTIIYQKLLLLSLRDSGHIYFQGIEDSLASELSLIMDESIDNIQVTLSYLLGFGLMLERESGDYYLPEIEKITGSETPGAERKRRQRTKDKQLEIIKRDNVTLLSHDGHKSVTTESESEKESDTDIESSSMTTTATVGTEAKTDDDIIFKKFKNYPKDKVQTALNIIREREAAGQTITNRTGYLRSILQNGFNDIIPAAVPAKTNTDTAPHTAIRREGYLAERATDRERDRLDKHAEELVRNMPEAEKNRRISQIIEDKKLARFEQEVAENMATKYLAAEIISEIQARKSQERLTAANPNPPDPDIEESEKIAAKAAVSSGNYSSDDFLRSLGVDPDSKERKENYRRVQAEQAAWERRKKELGIK